MPCSFVAKYDNIHLNLLKNDKLYLIRNYCDESILWDEKLITHNKFTRMFAVFEIFVKFSEIHGHITQSNVI